MSALALSIQQPWAWAIVAGLKDVENRTWHRSYRGPLLIHAGKTLDRSGIEFMTYELGLSVPDLQFGGIIGRCNVTDYIFAGRPNGDLRHCSPWFFGPVGWCLANAEPLPFMPLRGQLGLFNVAGELASPAVQRQDDQ